MTGQFYLRYVFFIKLRMLGSRGESRIKLTRNDYSHGGFHA